MRCAAGLNRSWLIVARARMYDALTADAAIELIRLRRDRHALCNSEFANWFRAEG